MAIESTKRLVIQLRRDYASRWEEYEDVVPALGEPCFVIDKNILKIGDGMTKFCDLQPINGIDISAVGDDQSIVVRDNVLTLAGYDAAGIGAQPRRTADGIEWIVPVDYSNDIKELHNNVEATLSQVESAVRAIEVVEF